MLNQILRTSMGLESVDAAVVDDTISLESIEMDCNFGNESAIEMAEVDNAIDVAGNTANALSALATGLENSEATGGLSAEGAALMAIAVDSAMKPFGGYVAKPMPALEDFEAESGRLASTQYGMEAIKETFQKVWKTILDLIDRAYQATMKFFDENISNVGRMKKSMASFAKKAAEAKGEPENKEVSIKYPHYITVDGKLMANLPAELAKVEKAVSEMAFSKAAIAAGNTLTESYAEGAKKDFADVKPELVDQWVENKLKGAIAGYQGAMVKAFDLKEYKGNEKAIKDAIGEATGFVGEIGVESARIVLKASSEKSVPVVEVQVNEQSKDKDADKVAPVSASEAVSIANAVVALCDAILDTKKESRASDKLKSGVTKAGNELVKLTSAEVKGDARRNIESFANSLKHIATNQKNLDKGIVSFATKFAQASSSVAVKSVSNLKEKKD